MSSVKKAWHVSASASTFSCDRNGFLPDSWMDIFAKRGLTLGWMVERDGSIAVDLLAYLETNDHQKGRCLLSSMLDCD
jgi:hypothetical protein